MLRKTITYHLYRYFEPEKLERFIQYHEAHPKVWKRFRFFALEKWHRGKTVGAKAIVEAVRWSSDDLGEGPDGFKINNLYTNYYARLLSEYDPRFQDYFRFRDSTG